MQVRCRLLTIESYRVNPFLDALNAQPEVSVTDVHTDTFTHKPQFILNYPNLKKKESPPYLLKVLVLDYINSCFPNYLQIFTDGSKLENNQAEAAFFIPKLNISRSFYIGSNFSIYTAELICIYQALIYINQKNCQSR